MIDLLAVVGALALIGGIIWLSASLTTWIVSRVERKWIMLEALQNNIATTYDELITIEQINAEYKRMQEQKDKLLFEKLTQIGEKLTEIEQKKKRN